jgi:hypothetical protein
LLTIVSLALGASAAATAAGAATLIKTQPPCSPNPCLTFDTAGVQRVVRSLSFTAPSRGTATVTFHGTLYCLSDNAGSANINIGTQIVEGNTPADGRGPGGLVFFFAFEPATDGSRTVNVNLASTRIFTITAPGTKTYRFRLRPASMSADTSCLVFNGVLTINFVS